ncbi:hypothetical protein [Brevibacillus reuszeri]|uniref:hypothetical protein n=1 Tax=Brevibacillus reuszeri TaxID=54915 RepID=UPI00289EF5EF|nr:hypothetical protein [Brevibacillus reuszeri]
MFIEDKLKKEYKWAANELGSDPALDNRILFAARKELAGRAHKKKGLFLRPKLTHVAASFVLLTGFGFATHSLLYKENTGSVQIEVQAAKGFELTQIAPEEIRRELASVENKLTTGETAIVYFAELEKEKHPLFQQNPVIGVEKPEVVADWKQWDEISQKASLSHSLPKQVADDFTFREGKLGTPYGAMIGQGGETWLHELQQESKATGKSVVWKVVPNTASPINTYTTLYQNEQKANIYFTVEVLSKDQVDIQVSTPETTQYEPVEVNGKKAHYTSNDQFLFSDSGQYKELSWISKEGEQTIMYHVATDSLAVSKEMLKQAAEATQF